MRINNNMMAMNTHRQLGVANNQGAKSMEKLSSGQRINRAGDDAAGLAISEKMRGQIRGLNQASSNAQDGISLIQTAEGALNETHAILQRMRELSVQAASDTNVGADRGEIQKELTQLTEEIDRIATTTEFNTMKLVNGDRAAAGSVTKSVNEVKNIIAADLSFSEGITGDAFKLKGDAITIDDTHDSWDGDNTTAAGVITLTKNTDGTLQVGIDTTAGTNVTVELTSSDKLEANADGNFKYDAHGISFEISAEDYKAMTGTTPMEITVTDGDVTAKTKATANDFTTNTAAPGDDVATVENFAVTKEAGWENIAEINVTSDGTDLTVTIKKADGTVSTDTMKQPTTITDTLSYDNHGVSFDFTMNDASAVAFTKKFESEAVDKTTTNDDKSLKFQVGANEDQFIGLAIEDMGSEALKINAIKVDSYDNAKAAVTTVNEAIERVSSERSKLGAVQNRLEHTIKNLDTSAENLQASEARIRDVDMAKEMMEQTKQNILAQASTAMLAQANQAPQAVLQLLR